MRRKDQVIKRTFKDLPNAERFLLLARHETPLPDSETIEHRPYPEPVDWGRIARAVNRYAVLLAEEKLGSFDADGDGGFFVEHDDLTDDEIRVVTEWFSSIGPSVTGDANQVFDGRHRLTYCWAVEPDLLLPVRCQFFDLADGDKNPLESSSDDVREQAVYLLGHLDSAVQERNHVFMTQVRKYLDGTRDPQRQYRAKQSEK